MQEHPVVKLIKKRFAENSKPGLRKDPQNKLGLVWRVAVCGCCNSCDGSALHYLPLVEVIDAVYGSSAGALAGSLFITNNMPLGPTMYYDDLNCNKFIDKKRIFSKKKSIMNLDFLLVDILQGSKPLNCEGVLNSKIPLNTVVSSIDQCKEIVFNKYDNEEDLFTLLKASASIPIVAGPLIEYKGERLFDASLYNSIPFNIAKDDEYTHILNLLTRPEGELRGQTSLFEKFFIARKLYKIKPKLADDLLERARKYKEVVQFLYKENKKLDHILKKVDPSFYSIFPASGTSEIDRMEKNRDKLIQASISAMNEVMKVFDIKAKYYHELFCPFNEFVVIPKIIV